MQCSKDGVRIFRTTFRSGRWLWARHSSTKLFVGGLSYDTNEAVLKDAFGRHGEIIEVKVICDHVSGRSKGYGFVRFTSETTATIALKEMDGQKYPCALCTPGVATWISGTSTLRHGGRLGLSSANILWLLP
nr:glycine-rich RNA-binding protein 2, mitochondrial-like isoform X2 [Quercus suber]